MRLSRLTLKDFGLYRGKQEFDLEPRIKYGKSRPIVLIGGHNGAGKTTILESIKLCLYGRLALGDRVRDQDYHQYLSDRIHRNRSVLIPSTTAYVEVEFDYARSGKRQRYLVRRAWESTNSKVVEDLTVLCDGKPLAEIESQFWPDFLRSLVPPGLSELFFFDGEKIQRLAEDASDTAALSDAVKSLLGLDLVERLQADLDLYAAKEARKAITGRNNKIEELEAQLKETELTLEQARHAAAEPRTQLEFVRKEIARLEQLLASEGGGLVNHRSELIQRQQWVDRRTDEMSREVRLLLEGVLPFAACPKLSAQLAKQLTQEARDEEHSVAQDRVSSAIKALETRLTSAGFTKKLGLTTEKRSALKAEIQAAAASALGPSHREVAPLHGLSRREREDVLLALRQSGEAARLAVRHCEDLVVAESELRELQEKINRVPEDEEVAPRITELNHLHRHEGELVATLQVRESSRAELEAAFLELKRQHDRLLEQQKKDKKTREKLDVAARTRDALSDYLSRLTATKVKQLEEATMRCFELLCRKGDLVRAVHIDPKTFRVDLSDGTGRVIPKAELSAGEKQIYAISVLWGLAKVSGRPLPMIIDTPLGRLDSIHRQRLIENYFPVASHQVVILSTDTEVDASCFQAMRGNVSHAVRLVHHKDGWTQAEPGYFWEEPHATASA